MPEPGQVLLLSCYELGRQPLAVATLAGFLRRAGYEPVCRDLSLHALDEADARRASHVAIAVPMHTALRVGTAAARDVRRWNPSARIAFHGDYALLNAEYLRDEGLADAALAGEIEPMLLRWLEFGEPAFPGEPLLERLDWTAPDRTGLPALEHYSGLLLQGERRAAAAVQTTRGCLHRCRHCPIPPVYGGRFFAIPREVVLEDVRRVVAAGAKHVTFADPDFLNGPGHARRIVEAVRHEFPELTFDFTAKVEHLLAERDLLKHFTDNGCVFVVSAVESLEDEVLAHLDKGHTRDDVFRLLELTRDVGVTLRPTFVPFTPWTSWDGYGRILAWIARERLAYQVDPVQLSIRLLVPHGSRLIELPAMRPHLGSLDRANFTYRWRHPDPGMDILQHEVEAMISTAARNADDAASTFRHVVAIYESSRPDGRNVTQAAGPSTHPRLPPERRPPRMTEDWFC